MSTADNLLSVLQLFTLERPEWTAEQAAVRLGVSGSTAYRYFSSLVRGGFLDSLRPGSYVLGPAFIAYDRQLRLLDPLLKAAEPSMEGLLSQTDRTGVVLLCRRYRQQVMCVHQVAEPSNEIRLSYERGRPLGLYRGAASLAILAHLPARTLRARFHEDADEIRVAGLGGDWESFKVKLRGLRSQEAIVAEGQLDAGMVGVSSPVRGLDRQVVGSVSLVAPARLLTDQLKARARTLVAEAGREIGEKLLSLR
jgi:DNA-binding IclR family transcriptional regulator